MSKTVLEQALEHLLNREEDKAAGLLHDYYVGIGRKVYEDIMADDINLEDEQALEDVTDAVDEVESDLTEEGDDEALEPTATPDGAATADVAGALNAEPTTEPVAGDAADVADAMMDVESALAKLKSEFEEMVTGGAADAGAEAGDAMPADADAEAPKESIEESAELEKVSSPDNGDKADQKNSPVAGKNPMMSRPATKFGGGNETGGTAPKAQDLGGTTKPALSKVATPKG
jgi:hypothetical protein